MKKRLNKRGNSRSGFNKYNILTKPKRSQHILGLPFSVLFSIFLIVVFIVVAFIAMGYFLDWRDCVGVGQFYEELQNKVDGAWASQSSDFEYEIDLPGGVDRVCFANLSASITGDVEDYEQIRDYYVYEANLFLLPAQEACNMPHKLIKHINISVIIENSNPYCVDVSENLRIKKDFYDGLVRVE